jgi:hypothetical protein
MTNVERFGIIQPKKFYFKSLVMSASLCNRLFSLCLFFLANLSIAWSQTSSKEGKDESSLKSIENIQFMKANQFVNKIQKQDHEAALAFIDSSVRLKNKENILAVLQKISDEYQSIRSETRRVNMITYPDGQISFQYNYIHTGLGVVMQLDILFKRNDIKSFIKKIEVFDIASMKKSRKTNKAPYPIILE